MNLEFVFMMLGTFIGVFLHIVYQSLYKNKKKKSSIDRIPGAHGRPDMGDDLNENSGDDWEDESSEEEVDGYKPNAGPAAIKDDDLFTQYPIEDIKQVLVVRNDLKMGKGKIGAQCGHATLSSYLNAKRMATNSKYWTKVIEKWNWEGVKKICVKVNTAEELIEVQKMANKLGLPNYLVADAGHTQIAAGSLTVCGIGPASSAQIDAITKDKKLL